MLFYLNCLKFWNEELLLLYSDVLVSHLGFSRHHNISASDFSGFVQISVKGDNILRTSKLDRYNGQKPYVSKNDWDMGTRPSTLVLTSGLGGC